MKLPADVSGRELQGALERIGFVFRRQKGSHMILYREEPRARVVSPDHKCLRPGTLKQILHEAQLTVEELMDVL